MTPERYQQIDQIFQAALAQEPARQAAFLDSACRGDETLRREVESLITSDLGGLSFIEDPAFEVAAHLLASDEPELAAGARIGRYEILSLLGTGGMGEVYLAHDQGLDRKIALKLLPTHFTTSQDRLQRFQQEARAASALNHPNIITIHEIACVEDRHFIATEFVDGETLRERMRRGSLDLNESLDVAIQVCSALAAAHQAGIVHRDIKPENIMLRRDGYVKVLDFGLAKLAEQRDHATDVETADSIGASSGLIMGTVKYMSPEQAQGLDVDRRSDLFTLGAVVFEMVTGDSPFGGQNARELVKSIGADDPLAIESPGCPSELRAVLNKSLRKERNERYQSAEQLLSDLKELKQRLDNVAYRQWSKSKRNAWLAAAAVLLFCLSSAAFFLAPSRNSATVSTRKKSIAVLPFKSIGADQADEYLRHGIAEAVINKLTGLREMIVRPLDSVTKYNSQNQDPIAAGKELGVDVVLDGGIQRVGDTYKVIVQLWRVNDRTSLFSFSCDDTCGQIFELEDSISQRVADAMAVRLTPQEQEYLAKRYTQNKEVYDLYLKGRYYFDRNTTEGYEKSVEYFNQAIKLESTYAPAYAGLSDAYSQLAWLDSTTSTDLMAQAKAAANRALEIDDGLAEVHTSVAIVKMMYDWDWPGAEAHFQRAIALKPNYALAWNYYSYGLAYTGQFDKAIEASKVEFELDPFSFTANFDLAAIHLYTHHTDEAIRQLQKVIEMEPKLAFPHHFLLNAYYQKGMYDEFIEKLIAMRSDPSLGDWSGIGLTPVQIRAVYAKAGWEGFLRGELQSVLARTQREYVPPKRIAILYAMLRENDKAMDWLEKTYQEHSKTIVTIKVDPRLQNLHGDPRFEEMLRRVGLSQ